MSNTFTGFVLKKNSKSGTGKGGKPWTAWSIRLEDKDGNEIPKWFRFGFKNPQLKEGDYVRFSCSEVNDQFATVDGDTLQVSKNPPDRAKKDQGGQPSAGGSGSTGGGSGYNSQEQRADRAWHASRGNAIDLVNVMLAHDGLPVSAASSKAGKAKRYEEIMEFVDKITTKFFRDEFPDYVGEFRVLERVADEGVSQPPKTGDLPADADDTDGVEFAEEGGADEDGFPADDDGF